MSRRLCVALVVAASLAVHIKGLTSPLLDYHYHRQCNTADIARNYYRNGLHFGTPQIDWEGDFAGKAATEFPLYMWLMGLLWPVAGLGELWGRLLSCGFSALTAVYLFLFLEKRMEREAALYAGVLFSCIPLEIYFGRTVQPEALALMATVAAFYHFDAWLDAPKARLHWAAATLFAFLAIAHKLPYAYILLPLAALAWLKPRRRSLADPWAWGACLLALAGVAGWYRYASTGVFVVPDHPAEFIKMFEYDRLPYFILFQFASRLPELATTYGGMVLGAIGAWELIGRRKQTFLGVWWGAVAVSLIIAGGYAHWHEYTSLPFAPINAALMGAGLLWLQQAARRLPQKHRLLARTALVLLVISVPVHAALRIRHWYHNGYPYLNHAGEAAAAVSKPADLFVCNERTSSVFLYYLDRKGWAWSVKEAGVQKSEELLGQKISEGAKFYATGKAMLDEPGLESFRSHLYSNAELVYDRDDLMVFKLKGS
jgi:4-amino-4-deoxy-L-arabinose transferase-like glycosyltransferase